jgi:hypothetical protein
MEMHIIHRKHSYSSVQEAMDHSDGLSVLAFFFQVNIALKLGNSSIYSHISLWHCITDGSRDEL